MLMAIQASNYACLDVTTVKMALLRLNGKASWCGFRFSKCLREGYELLFF